jgi:hypothetical protein
LHLLLKQIKALLTLVIILWWRWVIRRLHITEHWLVLLWVWCLVLILCRILVIGAWWILPSWALRLDHAHVQCALILWLSGIGWLCLIWWLLNDDLLLISCSLWWAVYWLCFWVGHKFQNTMRSRLWLSLSVLPYALRHIVSLLLFQAFLDGCFFKIRVLFIIKTITQFIHSLNLCVLLSAYAASSPLLCTKSKHA